MDVSKIDSIGAMSLVNSVTPSTENFSSRQIVAAVQEVNKSEMMGEGRQLTFSRDPQTRRQVIQIVDQQTGDVIDQIPPETVLQLAAQLK